MEIQDYPNYLIYEDGRVYNKKNKIFKKPTIKKNGYIEIDLLCNNKRKCFRIHRLVASHYIPNPNNRGEVDHIDRDRSNNKVENLRWVTHSENCQNTKVNKNNTLGIKNITFNNNRYRFNKTIKGQKHEKYFKTLDEAIEYKKLFFRNND